MLHCTHKIRLLFFFLSPPPPLTPNTFFNSSLFLFITAATAITTVSIVYLSSSIQLSTLQIGIFFLVTLVSVCVGTGLGRFITTKTNPNTSWKLSMIYLFITLMVGALVLDELPPTLKGLSYIWAVFVGLGLGWYYPTENLFFSMVMPPGQEAEFSGFYIYCGQILAWLFPLVFSILIEYDISQKYGVIVVATGFLIGLFFLMLTCSWEDIVKEAHANANTTTTTVTAAIGGEEEGTKNDKNVNDAHDLALDEEDHIYQEKRKAQMKKMLTMPTTSS
jgi:MFS family permease